ncbi:hypothetical protein OGAPHI_003274 [Ogataea philodendri]|uniref:Large ribosomal subunit protein mL40 n=1 Tax=Ogataea philodendri TaxID=1378263 RepID=A0A9P8P7V1_9ASCO|nr:uncharacterized protein OGAPHI_003274 [Ogataea philodendri]KAH3666825.1 hypothetical protein OGAPHI_003274 [Ogataea philodendri]
MFGLARTTQKSGINLQFVRTKRIRSGLDPVAQRVATQLSVTSATRKMPKMLKLCHEDYVKHVTVMRAWNVLQREKKQAAQNQLKQQYEAIKEANEDLKHLSPKLFEAANESEIGKRFPLEMRVPTDHPSRTGWFYDYTPRQLHITHARNASITVVFQESDDPASHGHLCSLVEQHIQGQEPGSPVFQRQTQQTGLLRFGSMFLLSQGFGETQGFFQHGKLSIVVNRISGRGRFLFWLPVVPRLEVVVCSSKGEPQVPEVEHGHSQEDEVIEVPFDASIDHSRGNQWANTGSQTVTTVPGLTQAYIATRARQPPAVIFRLPSRGSMFGQISAMRMNPTAFASQINETTAPAEVAQRTTEMSLHRFFGGLTRVMPPSTLCLAPEPEFDSPVKLEEGCCAGGIGMVLVEGSSSFVEARSKYEVFWCWSKYALLPSS